MALYTQLGFAREAAQRPSPLDVLKHSHYVKGLSKLACRLRPDERGFCRQLGISLVYCDELDGVGLFIYFELTLVKARLTDLEALSYLLHPTTLSLGPPFPNGERDLFDRIVQVLDAFVTAYCAGDTDEGP